MWRWKDWIDRRFMRKFNELPEMTRAAGGAASPLADQAALKEISAIAMRCGGCGAKVGATVLSRALGGDRAGGPRRRGRRPRRAGRRRARRHRRRELSVQTVDYFRAIVDDPYLFGKIAANHALGDVYAMGGEPQIGARHRHRALRAREPRSRPTSPP